MNIRGRSSVSRTQAAIDRQGNMASSGFQRQVTSYTPDDTERDAFDQLEGMDAQTGVAPGDAGSGMPPLADKPSGWRPEESASTSNHDVTRLEDPHGDIFEQLEDDDVQSGQLASDSADWRTPEQKEIGIPQ